ncbi:phosphate ABC transporter substrate-binding/OmpA family protein [Rheinheimera aquimaris]|uniref:phosphate ABC transporter substrate-binding/OmpA family protein n=1 Tax=Rheinheimera aquimaris TaxID=412437 RepID=UPI003A982342
MTEKLQDAATLYPLLQQLEQLCKAEFDIAVSAQKMRDDAAYRQLVLQELSQIRQPQLEAMLAAVQQKLQQQANTEAKAVTAQRRPTLLWAVAAVLVALVSGGAYWWFSQSPAAVVAAPPAQPAVKVSTAAAVSTVPVTKPAAAQLLFRLHGSNTVGEKLAPALLQAFLQQQQAEGFAWQQAQSPVERILNFNKAGTPQMVELHAHGSSTAFKDLASGKADIGMASRRISADEVEKLKPQLGDLSKIGNEHIVALDGLAVIVNQNNALKAISTEMLAKIFSGEVSRWSQLGGADQPITLYARDDKSGTFDTFKSLVLDKFGKQLSSNASRFESSSELSAKVSQDEYAIGFIGLNYISFNKALAISEGADSTPIYPTRFTISTEDYALSRRLYLYTPTAASQVAKDFAQFAISDEGQHLVEQTGLISQNIRVEQVYPISDAPQSYNSYASQGQRLSLNFRFSYGDNELDNKGKRDLQRLVRFMEQNSGRRLVLMGFSDAVGAVAKNAELALKRAKAVERELTARGIPVMAVESYGEMLPVANNDTESGRERNRRVEVWVI